MKHNFEMAKNMYAVLNLNNVWWNSMPRYMLWYMSNTK